MAGYSAVIVSFEKQFDMMIQFSFKMCHIDILARSAFHWNKLKWNCFLIIHKY